jgi:flagellar assembly factor FliW
MQEFNSARFGLIQYDPDHVITFPNGLIGFEHCTHFHLFHEEKDQPILFYLQSLDDAEVSFNLVDPTHLNVDYEISLNDDETKLLALEGKPEEVAIMLMVYRPIELSNGQIVQKPSIKAQTQSPILINPFKKIGLQKVGLKSKLVFTNVE